MRNEKEKRNNAKYYFDLFISYLTYDHKISLANSKDIMSNA